MTPKRATPRERQKSVKLFSDSSLRAENQTLYRPACNTKTGGLKNSKREKEHEERLIWQSASRIANEFGLDPVAVRNSMVNTGVVEEKQESDLDKDSANAN